MLIKQLDSLLEHKHRTLFEKAVKDRHAPNYSRFLSAYAAIIEFSEMCYSHLFGVSSSRLFGVSSSRLFDVSVCLSIVVSVRSCIC